MTIHLLADLLAALYRYHPDFVLLVTDVLLESITVGLETNAERFHQRRIAEAKYLCELYLSRIIDSSVIFETMYLILGFGYRELRFPPKNNQRPNSLNSQQDATCRL
jgi:regulator of nonsense transcripts 2